ncbi:MAG: hypothetical protein PVH91_02875 [Pseudomonadales bacterium]|jgi:hypothetical protein
MTFKKRLLVTLLCMVAASFLVGLVWRGLFDARMPSYLSGLVGGLAALSVWELLRSGR